ncbi:uncharacterized protein LY89DRAFT_54892 [Mollisia scopiformis]|uniref:Uncharacterized protein n=1 Tax=Mollisia scopiformis TaxID=149040 RepID=A0A194XBH3_MOLSC|nr:uncharacterized protein LY89DRAFT_54892 [Mollisia scopiformis]KUJ17513.1 hypothetical protein LY89DRAFT_54892 [Mollisia scopiformis]
MEVATVASCQRPSLYSVHLTVLEALVARVSPIVMFYLHIKITGRFIYFPSAGLWKFWLRSISLFVVFTSSQRESWNC